MSEQEAQRRRELQRRKKREQERRRRARKRMIMRVACLLVVLVVAGIVAAKLLFTSPVEKEVKVEAGTENLSAEQFLKEKQRGKVEISFVTDISAIEMNHVGKYEIVLEVKGKERKSTLIIEDTVAPTGEANPSTSATNVEMQPEELVTNIQDVTDVTCSFKTQPDLSQEGTVSVVVVLTDEGGNQTEVATEVTLINDTEAPVLDGVGPLTAFIGDPISYKGAITVTDNCDPDVELQVDNSAVDVEKEGTYKITYTAVDRSGNQTEKSTTITMKNKPDNYVDPETVYAEADKVLAEITTDDMTLKQKAKAIYKWCKANIGYVSTSEKESWTNGAYQGFTKKSGDCFVYFSTAKALLTRAGIPNIDIEKSDTSHSRHYWSLVDVGDGWYHFDTTPRKGGGEFFLLTDAEILSYSKAHSNSHIFDSSLYPATPTTDSTIE